MQFLPILILILIYGGIIFAIKSLCKPKCDSGSTTSNHRSLTKSQSNRVFSGVCGGLAEYFGYSATTVRLIFLFTGIGFFTYTILSSIIPESASSLL